MATLQTPISFRSSRFAARCSSVLTLIRYLGSARVALRRQRADLQQVGAAGEHRLFGHPDDGALELVGDLRGRSGRGDHVAARDVDLVGERQGDRLPGDGDRQVAAGGDDAGDAALPARRLGADRVARLDHAARDRSGEAAEVEVGAIDPLHRHPEHFLLPAGLVELDRFEEGHQRRAVVPRRVRARDEHVVAAQRRERHRGDVLEAELLRKLAVLASMSRNTSCE